MPSSVLRAVVALKAAAALNTKQLAPGRDPPAPAEYAPMTTAAQCALPGVVRLAAIGFKADDIRRVITLDGSVLP